MHLKEIGKNRAAARSLVDAPARWETYFAPVLFLALLIPVSPESLAAAEDQPAVDSALVIDVYSGAVAPDATQEKGFWLWLETLKKTEEPGGAWLPKVIHIEHPLSDKDFDLAEQGDANGQNIVAQGHVSRQADGRFKIVFSELGRPPAYSGATELTLAPGERRVLRLPILTQPGGQGNLETIAVIWTPALAKDQNGHSRFEVQ
jgi:hypothetical protein